MSVKSIKIEDISQMSLMQSVPKHPPGFQASCLNNGARGARCRRSVSVVFSFIPVMGLSLCSSGGLLFAPFHLMCITSHREGVVK